jgi:aromatic O-demethylase, cytochrome P450 subunit
VAVNVTDIVVDATLEELETDPHPIYERMWAQGSPIALIPDTGMVVVTTWDLCDRAIADDAHFGPTLEIFSQVYGDPNILSLSGSAHEQMRNVINPPLRPRAVRRSEDTGLRDHVVSCIEAVRGKGRAEAATEILEPISRRAVGNLIGLGSADDDTVARWFYAYGAYLVDAGRDSNVAERAYRAKAEVRDYIEAHVDELAGRPRESALAHMLFDGMPDGTRRSIDQIIGSFGVLIVGGIQEPAHAAATALLGVLSDETFRARVAADPQGWSSTAFEEGLRWIAPFGIGHRRVREDTVLGDVLFPEGTEVAIARDSANRDPNRYDRPERFDLDRPSVPHMAFGSSGPHFCMGHFVARTLGRLILEEMFRRLPGLRLDPDQEPLVHGWNVRGAKVLPLVWDA